MFDQRDDKAFSSSEDQAADQEQVGTADPGEVEDVVVVDAEAYNLPPEIAAEQILEFNPTLVAVVCYGNQVSASTQVMPGARAVCE